MLLLLATLLFSYQANRALGLQKRPELWLLIPWLAITLGLLALQLLGLPLAPLPLTFCLALLAAILKFINLKFVHALSDSAIDNKSEESTIQTLRTASQKHPLLASLLAITLALFILRSSLQPLRGFDTPFRWGALPSLITEQQSLDFYPPRSPEHFALYGYADGIPPLIAFGYAWIDWTFQSLSPSPSPRLRNLLVIAQLLSITLLLSRLGALHSPKATLLSPLLALSSPRLLGALADGQEIGALTLALLALLLLSYETPGIRRALLSGLAAALAGLTREYGLAWWLIGILFLMPKKTSIRELFIYSIFALGPPALWYLRNYALTGHPFYSIPLGALFPTNPVQGAYYKALTRTHPATIQPLHILALLSFAPLSWLALTLNLPNLRRQSLFPMTAAAILFVLWQRSIPFTDGGWYYSTRVLTPLLALIAAFAAQPAAELKKSRSLGALLFILALPYAWITTALYPQSPLELPIQEWPKAALRTDPVAIVPSERYQQRLAQDLRARNTSRILTTEAYLFAFLRNHDFQVVSPFSPEVAFLFGPPLPQGESSRKLKEFKINTLIIPAPRGPQDSGNFYLQSPNIQADLPLWKQLLRLEDKLDVYLIE